MGYVCNGQSDTIRKTADSLVIQQNIINQKDSLSSAIQKDTISTTIQKDSISSAIQKDTISTAIQSDSANYALLFVYRPRNYTGSLIGYDLAMNNSVMKEQFIGRVKNNSKFVVKIFQEGMTQIVARTEAKRSVTLDVRYGKKYYLKCGVTMGVMVGRPELSLVIPEQGELDFENVQPKVK